MTQKYSFCPQRTHTLGQLRKTNEGQKVLLTGWVTRARNLGGLVFVDLRDRHGLTQVVFDPAVNKDAFALAQDLAQEYVIAVEGSVAARPENMTNKDMPTGDIEIHAQSLQILSRSEPLPIPIGGENLAAENLRLEYRYLDLRRKELAQNFSIRHKMYQSIRNFLDTEQFLEVETPILSKATPEGARDYLVPSRVHQGKFYALPQSPQLFKQLLMISGFDRYYQIARCFRDEDLRADRQPEFTQLDMELSFIQPEQIFDICQRMCKKVFIDVLNIDIQTPFARMTYNEAMQQYATDKPDLRWPFPLLNMAKTFAQTQFNAFASVLQAGGEIRGLRIPGGANLSRSQIDKLTKAVKETGAKGLVWCKFDGGKLQSPIEKFLSEQEKQDLIAQLSLSNEDIGFLVADEASIARASLERVKKNCVESLSIAPTQEHAFVWVTDFPLFEYDAELGRKVSLHHPFTSPHPEDMHKLDKDDKSGIRSLGYDLVLNGFELGGGSIRIHQNEVQKKIFAALGIGDKEATNKFGFFLEALRYGTPPHGGIAFGLDRMAMLLCGSEAIREVIAFPKTQSAMDIMSKAPSNVDQAALDELSISCKKS